MTIRPPVNAMLRLLLWPAVWLGTWLLTLAVKAVLLPMITAIGLACLAPKQAAAQTLPVATAPTLAAPALEAPTLAAPALDAPTPVAPTPVAPATTPAPAQDLLQIYAQARAADPQLAGVVAQRGIQQEAAAQAQAVLLPQWQLEAGTQRLQARGTDSAAAHQLTSSISQVLLDLGRLRGREAERTELSAHDERLRAAEQALCARVAQGYFGVLAAQARLATAEADEGTYAAQVQQAQSRFTTGLSAQVDVEQARTYHALARTATLAARQALVEARQALAEITGQPTGTLKPLAKQLPALPPEPVEATVWADQAQRQHPLLRAGLLSLEASGQRIAAARAQHYPTLALALDSERRDGSAYAEADRGRSQHALALRVSIPLYTGGAIESSTRQAAHRRDAQREALEADRRAVVRDALAQHQAVLTSAAQMDTTREAVAAAERALAATRAGQSLGTRTMTDLLLAIQTHSSARSAHDQARHAHVLARLLLQRAAGTLGLAELAAVNQLLEGSSS